MADMDWSEMEGLFCQQAPLSAHSSPKLGYRDQSGDNSERRVRKETSEVRLKSLNVYSDKAKPQTNNPYGFDPSVYWKHMLPLYIKNWSTDIERSNK